MNLLKSRLAFTAALPLWTIAVSMSARADDCPAG